MLPRYELSLRTQSLQKGNPVRSLDPFTTHAREHRGDQPAKDSLNTNPYRPDLGFGSWSLHRPRVSGFVLVLHQDCRYHIRFKTDVFDEYLDFFRLHFSQVNYISGSLE